MRRILNMMAIAALVLGMFSACEKSDCLCKYYDDNNTELARESWDGEEVNPTECENLESNTSVEVDDQTIAASTVSCSQEW